MSKTEIRHCNCFNLGQDALHGINRRVHNLGVKGWRCTSCLTVSGAGAATVATKGGNRK